MSKKAIARTIVRSCAAVLESAKAQALNPTLSAHKSISPETIKRNLIELDSIGSDPDADYRTRMNAKRFIVEHSWAVYEHENPPIEKSELTIKTPQKIQVELLPTKEYKK